MHASRTGRCYAARRHDGVVGPVDVDDRAQTDHPHPADHQDLRPLPSGVEGGHHRRRGDPALVLPRVNAEGPRPQTGDDQTEAPERTEGQQRHGKHHRSSTLVSPYDARALGDQGIPRLGM